MLSSLVAAQARMPTLESSSRAPTTPNYMYVPRSLGSIFRCPSLVITLGSCVVGGCVSDINSPLSYTADRTYYPTLRDLSANPTCSTTVVVGGHWRIQHISPHLTRCLVCCGCTPLACDESHGRFISRGIQNIGNIIAKWGLVQSRCG